MASRKGILKDYNAGAFWCELTGRRGKPARHTEVVRTRLARMKSDELQQRARDAEREL
jgi:hypothetical protein